MSWENFVEDAQDIAEDRAEDFRRQLQFDTTDFDFGDFEEEAKESAEEFENSIFGAFEEGEKALEEGSDEFDEAAFDEIFDQFEEDAKEGEDVGADLENLFEKLEEGGEEIGEDANTDLANLFDSLEEGGEEIGDDANTDLANLFDSLEEGGEELDFDGINEGLDEFGDALDKAIEESEEFEGVFDEDKAKDLLDDDEKDIFDDG